MAPTQPCAKYQYIVTPTGPKILPVEDPACKDEESPADYNAGGYLPVQVGDTFKSGRYRVIRKLGWGHFSTVWLVKDTQEARHSALKVVKSAGRYAETARDEIKLLSRVASFSPTHPGRSHIVSFLDSFVNQGPEASHVCIVFEPLGENLLAMIERNKKKGVPRGLVKAIARQILLGLQYLHDECDLVHTDIKPENILISIPDIEAHIHTELSQSPTPTSRRVGVPLPPKSRAGVSIPQSHQRSRRQVQIFDSQPLGSPGRSVDPTRSGYASMNASIVARYDHSGSGGNSIPSSYMAQMHLSRLTGAGTPTASGTAKSLSSAASKFTSSLSSSVPHPVVPTSKSDSRLFSKKTALPPHNPLSPSTSSSSSSISSTAASTTAGSSSMISTPPTSLSHSLGNAVSGFMGMAKMGGPSVNNAVSMSEKGSNRMMEGLPMKSRNGKAKASIEDELEDATSTSWKDHIKYGSWTEKASLSSSYKSSLSGHGKSKLCQVQSHPSQLRLGAPSSIFWKDPGAAAPAPAVVVSAVAGADGGEDTEKYFDFASRNSARTAVSESSSATATVASPSCITTPVEPTLTKNKASALFSATKQPIGDDALRSPTDATPVESTTLTHTIVKSNPSLLTQTAPVRTSPPSLTKQRNTSNTTSTHFQHTSTNPISPPSPTLTPSAPPPTPADTPSISSLIPPPVTTSARPPTLPIQVPIPEPSSASAHPLLSIKIADLGNATPSTKHYTEDIQTRQYRAPEAILGRCDWDSRADIWSVACVVFELLTAEFLFDPHGQGELFTKDDDHMAQIIELLGDFPLEVKMGGRYSRELFDHTGTLRYIHSLKPWPLKRVMKEKYLYTDADAQALSDFLLPMLAVDMKHRNRARDMLHHPWLTLSRDEELVEEW